MGLIGAGSGTDVDDRASPAQGGHHPSGDARIRPPLTRVVVSDAVVETLVLRTHGGGSDIYGHIGIKYRKAREFAGLERCGIRCYRRAP